MCRLSNCRALITAASGPGTSQNLSASFCGRISKDYAVHVRDECVDSWSMQIFVCYWSACFYFFWRNVWCWRNCLPLLYLTNIKIMQFEIQEIDSCNIYKTEVVGGPSWILNVPHVWKLCSPFFSYLTVKCSSFSLLIWSASRHRYWKKYFQWFANILPHAKQQTVHLLFRYIVLDKTYAYLGIRTRNF